VRTKGTGEEINTRQKSLQKSRTHAQGRKFRGRAFKVKEKEDTVQGPDVPSLL